MGSDYSIIDNDVKALDNSYNFLMKNKSKYDPDFVSEVDLLYHSTIPYERKWETYATGGDSRYLFVSKEQYASYQKLRKLLLSPKMKKSELTSSEKVIAIAASLSD